MIYYFRGLRGASGPFNAHWICSIPQSNVEMIRDDRAETVSSVKRNIRTLRARALGINEYNDKGTRSGVRMADFKGDVSM